jgi:hypothetical protein
MVVLHDFTPCVDDELEVKRGQVDTNLMMTLEHEHDLISPEGTSSSTYLQQNNDSRSGFVIQVTSIPSNSETLINVYSKGLMVVYNTQNCWGYGLCSSSRILNK